jgi:hypothetical protein
MISRRISRRQALRALSVLPVGFIAAACSSDPLPKPDMGQSGDAAISTTTTGNIAAMPAPTAAPPFVVAAGEQRSALMGGTPYETPLFVYGTGTAGPIVMVLGGVHGNEPGGWLAADRVVERLRPASGALLVLPRANQKAIALFERTTEALGDLNRLYPGRPDGLPMERMAQEIVDTLRAYHVNVVVDMHESWAFYRDRPQNGTAFLGQTVATNPTEPGVSLARSVVQSVNQRVLSTQEEFFFREFPPNRLPDPNSALPFDTSGNPQAAVSGGSRSSLGLPAHIPGLVSILVEMGQQQALERRVALHVEVLQQVMREIGSA